MLDLSSSGQILYPKVFKNTECKNAERENAKTATAPRTLEWRECDTAESTRVPERKSAKSASALRMPLRRERKNAKSKSPVLSSSSSGEFSFLLIRFFNFIQADCSYHSPCHTSHLIFFLLSHLHGVLDLDTSLVDLQKEYSSVITGPLKIHILYNCFISLVLHT